VSQGEEIKGRIFMDASEHILQLLKQLEEIIKKAQEDYRKKA
jgi:hypothetical protein